MKRGINDEIRNIYLMLRPSERKVANVLLDPDTDIRSLSLAGLAEAAGVSEPTVVRFARTLNFAGFRELKDALLRNGPVPERQRSKNKKLSEKRKLPEESMQKLLASVPAQIIQMDIRHLEETLQNLSPYDMMKAVRMIASAQTVFLIASENSCAVADDLVSKLIHLGIRAVFYPDPALQNMGAGNLTAEDTAIGISYSGVSGCTVDALHIALEAGAHTIAITNFPDAPVCQWAETSLCTFNRQYLYGGTIFSRCSQTALVDVLYSSLLMADYPRFSEHLAQIDSISLEYYQVNQYSDLNGENAENTFAKGKQPRSAAAPNEKDIIDKKGGI